MILVVEDNPADVRLLEHAFGQLDTPPDVKTVTDGVAALEFMNAAVERGEIGSLELVLLDLGLPRLSGHEVLKKIKSNASQSMVPVIITSSSSDLSDIQESYRLHANSYIVKPFGVAEYISIARKLNAFWLETAALPFGEPA